MFIVNSWKWICSKISKETTTTITYSLRFVCFDVMVLFFCSAAAAVILPFHFVHILILLQCYKTKSSYTLHHQAKMNVNAQHQHLNRNQMAEWLYYIVLPYYAWILVVLIAFSLANSAPMNFMENQNMQNIHCYTLHPLTCSTNRPGATVIHPVGVLQLKKKETQYESRLVWVFLLFEMK